MLNKTTAVDFVVIGAGIIGLSIARELTIKHPKSKIAVLEKESEIGLHASGRNSGVLHSGIYYQEDSLKAKFCLEGSIEMATYCKEHQLPFNRIGKLILPSKKKDINTLNILYKRAKNNGAEVHLIDDIEVKKMEPEAFTAGGYALFSPGTTIVDPKAILNHLFKDLLKKNVIFLFNSYCSKIDYKLKKLQLDNNHLSYGHLFNTAGLHADVIAKACGLGDRYAMIPFKGIYYELISSSKTKINHLIYPVPNMDVPFLGVHFTKSIHNKIYVGPTAIPALGREHYKGLEGIKLNESLSTLFNLGQQYMLNKQGFRQYTHHEMLQFIKSRFVATARFLIPNLIGNDLVKSSKVGIRAQLYDKHKKELIMDFMVKNTENETHILNAVSPAFTSAFSFSKFVVRSLNKESL